MLIYMTNEIHIVDNIYNNICQNMDLGDNYLNAATNMSMIHLYENVFFGTFKILLVKKNSIAENSNIKCKIHKNKYCIGCQSYDNISQLVYQTGTSSYDFGIAIFRINRGVFEILKLRIFHFVDGNIHRLFHQNVTSAFIIEDVITRDYFYDDTKLTNTFYEKNDFIDIRCIKNGDGVVLYGNDENGRTRVIRLDTKSFIESGNIKFSTISAYEPGKNYPFLIENNILYSFDFYHTYTPFNRLKIPISQNGGNDKNFFDDLLFDLKTEKQISGSTPIIKINNKYYTSFHVRKMVSLKNGRIFFYDKYKNPLSVEQHRDLYINVEIKISNFTFYICYDDLDNNIYFVKNDENLTVYRKNDFFIELTKKLHGEDEHVILILNNLDLFGIKTSHPIGLVMYFSYFAELEYTEEEEKEVDEGGIEDVKGVEGVELDWDDMYGGGFNKLLQYGGKKMAISKISLPIYIKYNCHNGIHFACGLDSYNNYIYLSYGVNDFDSNILILPNNKFFDIIHRKHNQETQLLVLDKINREFDFMEIQINKKNADMSENDEMQKKFLKYKNKNNESV
jgi:hypothetical protein